MLKACVIWLVAVAAIGLLVATAGRLEAHQPPSGFPAEWHAAFCGLPGNPLADETAPAALSERYSRALIAEIERRNALGAKTLKDALGEIERDYCSKPGAKQ